MKNKTLWLVVAIVIVVVLVIAFSGKKDNSDINNPNLPGSPTSSSTPLVNSPAVSSTETTKVSSKISEYQNSELGFSIKYPSSWEKIEANYGVSFMMPIDKSQVSTVANLQADISVVSDKDKCAFPPITTIKERGTLKVGDDILNMISMTNNVQGRTYFNRMYSLSKTGVCYMFSLATITQSPTAKGLKGSDITQAENNNKAIVKTADTAFIDMVKTFAFVKPVQGIDETKAVPTKR